MKPTNPEEAPNATIWLLRRLAAEKRETKRQMRQSFKNDPEVLKAIKELDRRNNENKS